MKASLYRVRNSVRVVDYYDVTLRGEKLEPHMRNRYKVCITYVDGSYDQHIILDNPIAPDAATTLAVAAAVHEIVLTRKFPELI